MQRELTAVIRVEINPVAWKSPTAFAVRRQGKLSAAVAPSMEVNAYKQALSELMRQAWAGREPITGPVRLDWRFNRCLVTYVSPTGRNVTKHRQDGTNLQKAAEDALQPHVIKNDVQVLEWSGAIVRQEKDVTDPFVEVSISLLHP